MCNPGPYGLLMKGWQKQQGEGRKPKLADRNVLGVGVIVDVFSGSLDEDKDEDGVISIEVDVPGEDVSDSTVDEMVGVGVGVTSVVDSVVSSSEVDDSEVVNSDVVVDEISSVVVDISIRG